MSIHKNYAHFEEQQPVMMEHVDNMYKLVNGYAKEHGIPLTYNDHAERFVEAIATYIMVSRPKITKALVVNWFAKSEEFITYEFETTKNLYIDGNQFDLFRLFLWNDGDKKEIMVANRDDYDIHEDVTEFFDVAAIQAQCENARVADVSDEYNAYYEKEVE